MLDEYILGQLEIISHKKGELSEKLRQLSNLETEENQKITKLLNVDDVGKELFSPRGSGEPLKVKIKEIRRHIEELLLQEAELQDQIETLTADEEKYKEMLEEARRRPVDKDRTDVENEVMQHNQDKRSQKELEIVLSKLDKCIEYVRTDHAKCQAELNNLRYYVKALLSSMDS